MEGSNDMVSFLLERGANPLSEFETALCVMQPLHLAVEWGHFTKTKYLLEAIEKRGIPLQDWRYLTNQETVKKWEPKIERLLEYFYWKGRYTAPNLKIKVLGRRQNSSGNMAETSRYNLRAKNSAN